MCATVSMANNPTNTYITKCMYDNSVLSKTINRTLETNTSSVINISITATTTNTTTTTTTTNNNNNNNNNNTVTAVGKIITSLLDLYIMRFE
jgi:uncharacterized protein YcnI